jgi:hypothetical protein
MPHSTALLLWVVIGRDYLEGKVFRYSQRVPGQTCGPTNQVQHHASLALRVQPLLSYIGYSNACQQQVDATRNRQFPQSKKLTFSKACSN